MIPFYALITGMLYRLGGKAGWNTKFRDFGCAAMVLLTLYTMHVHAAWWVWCIVAIIQFASLTTYWGFINKWICKVYIDKCDVETKCPLMKKKCEKDSEYWWNWLAHGFGLSAAILPFCIFGNVSLGSFFIRVAVCAITVSLWSEAYDDVEIEETGRGFILLASLVLLNIK